MEGTDGQNYYAVMDFYGSMITEATKCDLAIATEKGNIVVKNGDGLNEIELAKLETPEEQSLNLMPLLETNRSWRNEQTAGMDIQGNTYGNAIEYSFVTDPFGTEEYSTCDAWYLGENYSRLTGTWYFPADQIQDGFAHIRLIGDGLDDDTQKKYQTDINKKLQKQKHLEYQKENLLKKKKSLGLKIDNYSKIIQKEIPSCERNKTAPNMPVIKIENSKMDVKWYIKWFFSIQ